MDYKYISQLLDRYWQGETTLEEEQILRSFFSQLCIPEELQKYRSLFIYEQTEKHTNTLGDDFDERMMALIDEPETVEARHEAPSTLLDAIKAMNGAIDMFVAARVAVESAARDLEALRVSRLDHLDLDWSEPDHIWLNGFACIRPTDEFAAQVGRDVIRAAMQAHPKHASFTVNAS